MDNPAMDLILDVAIQAAKQAGDIIQLAAKDLTNLNVEQKSLHDYVSEVDRESESTITAIIKKHFPDHKVLGEEYGETGGDHSGFQWVVDPLDGTTNFLRSIPHYAVSIGVMSADVLQHAVVFDPVKCELFTASQGQGAYLNGQAINVSNAHSVRGSLLSTGVPFSGQPLANIDAFKDSMLGLLAQDTSGIRRLGSAALDLAYVAAGRYDGFWEGYLQLWDIAAGTLLVQEAGGIVTDLNGQDSHLTSGNVLAAAPQVHVGMLKVTQENYGAI